MGHRFPMPWALALLLAAVLAIAGCDSGEELPPEGAVEVTVRGVEDLAGGQVAGVLYEGEGLDYDRVVGGFGVVIDTDPFSTTQLVRVGEDDIVPSSLFPYVTDEVLTAEPGVHTLMLWVADSRIGPYSRWVPGGPDSLIGCSTTFEIEAGQGTSLTIVDGLENVSTGVPRCTVATT